jgi:FkbM family methyltransferase
MAFRNEPETIHWLETHVQSGDCLWDIGANVGAWTLYAARARNARVVAFEPSAQTFGALYKNILINRLDGTVDAFCAALSDETGPGRFHLFDPAPGSGLNSLGAPENVHGRFDSRLSQATLAFRMDDFVRLAAVPRPDHLKIDVDGIEEKVLAGALETLPGIKTLIIEDEPARPGAEAWRERVYGLLGRAGFVKATGGPAGANQIFVNERRA